MLQNPFPPKVRGLYLFNYACFNCSRSGEGLELHHIFGRISATAMNAIPLCRTCHANVTNSRTERGRFFFLNMEYLFTNDYKITRGDVDLVLMFPWLMKILHPYELLEGASKIPGNPL